jgi:hypothetical protein
MVALGVLATPAALAAPHCIAYTEPASTADVSVALSSHFDWLNEHGYRTVAPNDSAELQSSSNAPERRLVLVFPAINRLFRDVVAPQLSVFAFRAGVLDTSDPARVKDDSAIGTAAVASRPLTMLRENVTRIRSASGIFRPVQIAPQGDIGPGAAGRRYVVAETRYESVNEMASRLRGELGAAATATSSIRTMLWPQHDYSHAAIQAASAAGFTNHLVLSGDVDSPSISTLVHCRPLSMAASLSELARALRPPEARGQRVLRLELDPGRLADEGYARSIAQEVRVIRPSEIVVDAFVSQGAPAGGYAAIFPSRRVRMAGDLLGHLISQLKSIDGLRTAAVMPAASCPSDQELSLAEEIVISAPIDSLYLESDPLRGGTVCAAEWSRVAERLRHWRPELRIARSLTQLRIDDYVGMTRLPSSGGLPGTMIEIDADAGDQPLITMARRFSSDRPLMIDSIVMTRMGDPADGVVAARTLREGGVLNRGVRARLAFNPDQTEQLRRELSTGVFPYPEQAAIGAGGTDAKGGR